MTANPPDSAPQDAVDMARKRLKILRARADAGELGSAGADEIILTQAVLNMQVELKGLRLVSKVDQDLSENHYAEVAALRTALEPFAKFGQEIDGNASSKDIGDGTRITVDFNHYLDEGLNVGDCRAAVAALYAAPPAVPDTEPHCFDCGREYIDGGFQDLILPNDIWRQISPTSDEGGLLCPSCICKRAHDLEITSTAIFRSGPFVDRERADPNKRADTADAAPDTTAIVEAARRENVAQALFKHAKEEGVWFEDDDGYGVDGGWVRVASKYMRERYLDAADVAIAAHDKAQKEE